MEKPIPQYSSSEIEFETKLIRAVYNYRWLYDNDHPDFHNITTNRISWTKVAQTCQKSFVECTKKWNSLLQTYFSGPSKQWVHLQDLRAFEPYISSNIRILSQDTKPVGQQKTELQRELLKHGPSLFSSNTTDEQKNQIWMAIVKSLNQKLPSATKISMLNWQKCWYDLKQEFGVQHMLRSKLQSMGTNVDVTKYSEDDIKILDICGKSINDLMEDITLALTKNNEFGIHKYSVIAKCKKCTNQPDEIFVDGLCEKCSQLPLCPLCHNYEETITKSTATWSKLAKNLLPPEFASCDTVSVCSPCWLQLKKKASMEWKSCRICDTQQPYLESLYDPALCGLRMAFESATHVWFSEIDGLPGYICKVCKIQLQQLTNFYTKFCRTQENLRNKHALYFVGSPKTSGHAVIKNGKVFYNTGNGKGKAQKSVEVGTLIQPLDNNNHPSNNKPIQQPLQPAIPYKIAPAAPPVAPSATTKSLPTVQSAGAFKRISIQKPTLASSDNDHNQPVIQAKPGKVFYDPPLAIKEIFSLQPNGSAAVQKPTTPMAKSGISVIPTAVLQQQQPSSTTKLNEVLSNKALTVTRKTMELPTAAQPTINPSSLHNTITPGQESNVGIASTAKKLTVTKRIVINSKTKFIPPNPKQTIAAPESVVLVPPVQQQPAKPASSKPAIFTINEFETIDEALPVFCIPKNNTDSTETLSANEGEGISAAEQELMDFNPQNPPLLKSEIGMKVIRLNGNVVTVKPHPYIAEAFISVDENGKPKNAKAATAEGGLCYPSYIRKVSAGETTSLLKPKLKKVSAPVVPLPIHKAPSIQPNPVGNSRPVQAILTPDLPTTLEQQQQTQMLQNPHQLQQTQQQQPQQQQMIQNPHQLQQQQPQQQQMLQIPLQLQQAQQQQPQQQQMLQNPLQLQQLQQQHMLQAPHQLQETHQQQPQQQQIQTPHQLQQAQQQQPQQQQMLQIPHQLQQAQQQQPQMLQNPHQLQQPQQQHMLLNPHQLQQQQNAKRPRKYWGTVGEFQVAPLLPRSPPPPIVPAPEPLLLTKPIGHPHPSKNEDSSKLNTSALIPQHAGTLHTHTSTSKRKVKEELDDDDVEFVSVTPATALPSNKDVNLFLPDSFDMFNVNFGADVSQIFHDYLYPKTTPPVEEKKNESTTPAASIVEHRLEAEQNKIKTDVKQVAAVVQAEPPQTPDKKITTTKQEQPKLKMKKLRVRIKRFKNESTKPYLRLTRSCTTKNITPQQTILPQTKRKSMRFV